MVLVWLGLLYTAATSTLHTECMYYDVVITKHRLLPGISCILVNQASQSLREGLVAHQYI